MDDLEIGDDGFEFYDPSLFPTEEVWEGLGIELDFLKKIGGSLSLFIED
jgi:hypothetical protein